MKDEMTASAMNLSRQKELKVEDSGSAWVGFCRRSQQRLIVGCKNKVKQPEELSCCYNQDMSGHRGAH